MVAKQVHQLLCGDITYIATDEGWLYLAAVMDMFSPQVVGWSLQPRADQLDEGCHGDGLVAKAT